MPQETAAAGFVVEAQTQEGSQPTNLSKYPEKKLSCITARRLSIGPDTQHQQMPDGTAELLLHDNEPAIPDVKVPGLPPVKDSGLPTVKDGLEILCGPLLNYKGMQIVGSKAPIWHGSVLIVAKPGSSSPSLKVQYIGVQSQTSRSGFPLPNELGDRDNVREGSTPGPPDAFHASEVSGVKLYSDPVKAFWRFSIDLALQDHEARWQYTLTNIESSGSEPGTLHSRTFFVPSAFRSMRIMFHSCNGFSAGTDEDEWSGPALWNDALRIHAQKPFHAMIGGGDQIYNDGVRVEGPLKAWTDIGNPKKRKAFPFDEELRAACDAFYFSNYVSLLLNSTFVQLVSHFELQRYFETLFRLYLTSISSR